MENAQSSRSGRPSWLPFYRVLDAQLGRAWWLGIGYYFPGKNAGAAVFVRGSNGYPVQVASLLTR